MEWANDADLMDKMTQWLGNQKEDLGNLLNALHPHNDGSPMFAFAQIFGMFVFRFSDHLEKHTETDAINLTLADVANHPTVQGMVASMVQSNLNRGLNLE
jgi:hypothetical protein